MKVCTIGSCKMFKNKYLHINKNNKKLSKALKTDDYNLIYNKNDVRFKNVRIECEMPDINLNRIHL